MAKKEYIDRDKAIEELYEAYDYEYPTASGDFDEYASCIVPNVLRQMPVADVVPRAEVEKIFAEIIERISSKIPTQILLVNKEQDFSDGVVFGKREAFFEMINTLAELKKNYVEGKNG